MNKQIINSIVFDFGGVLLDWNPRHLYRRFFNTSQEMDKFLSEINFSEWNLQQDNGRPFKEGITKLSAEYPGYSTLIQAYFDFWEESISGPIEGSVEILRRLKKAGFALYGLSNWSAETFPIAYKKYEFFTLFDEIIISGDVKVVKPDPRIFEIILDKINRPAVECLLIDDSIHNINIAQKLGFCTIHFSSAEQLEIGLQELNLLGALDMERKEI